MLSLNLKLSESKTRLIFMTLQRQSFDVFTLFLAAPFMFSSLNVFFKKNIDDKLINNEKCKQGFLVIIWRFLVLSAIDCIVFVVKRWKGVLIIIAVTSKCFIQVSGDIHIRWRVITWAMHIFIHWNYLSLLVRAILGKVKKDKTDL